MFETTASLGKALMDGLWSLFGIYVPGFSFTFGQMSLCPSVGECHDQEEGVGGLLSR